MRVHVKLFAVARELSGRDQLVVELPPAATVRDLRQVLVAQAPALEKLARHVLFAVGTEYVDDAQTLCEDAEVACIPPVSGG